MTPERRTHVAFHVTGARTADLDPVEGLDVRPALLARYRDLTALRYDFPVVLTNGGPTGAVVQPLSGLVDDLLRDVAQGDEAARIARHVLKLESHVRALAARGERGPLSALWDAAAARCGAHTDALVRDSLDRARAALTIDGDVVDCDDALPVRLLTHAWREAYRAKASRFRGIAGRLILQLAELMRGDLARSDAGRRPERLKAAFGAVHEDSFDFTAMSRVLATAGPSATLDTGRRQRIEALIAALGAQQFYPATEVDGAAFVFDRCTAALRTYRERMPRVVALARALAVAELEVAGDYDEAKHDLFFRQFGEDGVGLDPRDLALFPDYFVHVDATSLDPVEHAALLEILSEGLPIKVLFQTDDILRPGSNDGPDPGRGGQLAAAAMGLAGVFVLQSPSSHVVQLRDQIVRGFAYHGPALFSVFTGAATTVDLPPYLAAAAALESRAFPAFTYDPAAGPDWASRFDLSTNPQPELDWPLHRVEYESVKHERVSEDVAFTFVEFAACDRRYARHLARVPRADVHDNLVAVAAWLASAGDDSSGRVPSLLMVDRDNRLQRVLADRRLIREARQCRERWHSLQELGGIHNSHAARLLARERQSIEAAARQQEARVAAAPLAAQTPIGAQPIAPPITAEAGRSDDEPYIETPRCSTCNECTNLNNRMFAYNENRQAFIADPGAGTYRQLIEAAESCQVSIIHPGKPRNPNEPGLDELLERAAAFR